MPALADLTTDVAPLTPLAAFFLNRLNGLKDFRKLKALKPDTKPTRLPTIAWIAPLGSELINLAATVAACDSHLTTLPSTLAKVFRLLEVVKLSQT